MSQSAYEISINLTFMNLRGRDHHNTKTCVDNLNPHKLSLHDARQLQGRRRCAPDKPGALQ